MSQNETDVDYQQNTASDNATDSMDRWLAEMRVHQQEWAAGGIASRLKLLRRLQREVASQQDDLIAAMTSGNQRSPLEALVAEVIPLVDAIKFLRRNARRVLRERRLSWVRWGGSIANSVRYQQMPYGTVLIVGPSNYPLFLAAVQWLQALIAGNAVIVKPGGNASIVLQRFGGLLSQAGFPSQLSRVLPERIDVSAEVLEGGVDKLVLTGGVEAGGVLGVRAAEQLTPTVMELSGCDAIYLLPTADLELAIRAVVFAMRFNQGATCMAPRRIFVLPGQQAALEHGLPAAVENLPAAAVDRDVVERADRCITNALANGARLLTSGSISSERFPPTILSKVTGDMEITGSDLMAPILSIVPVASLEEAIEVGSRCPLTLSAAVFGDRRDAQRFAERLGVGCVTINDLIAPTADPRVSFGGRNDSGWGKTRGAEGLLEMTVSRYVIERRGRWKPHLETPDPQDQQLLAAWLRYANERWGTKKIELAAALLRALKARRNSK